MASGIAVCLLITKCREALPPPDVILSGDPQYLKQLVLPIRQFLNRSLKLDLHEGKIKLRKLNQGIDYLGYVIRSHHRVLRTKTKNRILKRAARGEIDDHSLCSYLGILRHCRGWGISKKLLMLQLRA